MRSERKQLNGTLQKLVKRIKAALQVHAPSQPDTDAIIRAGCLPGDQASSSSSDMFEARQILARLMRAEEEHAILSREAHDALEAFQYYISAGKAAVQELEQFASSSSSTGDAGSTPTIIVKARPSLRSVSEVKAYCHGLQALIQVHVIDFYEGISKAATDKWAIIMQRTQIKQEDDALERVSNCSSDSVSEWEDPDGAVGVSPEFKFTINDDDDDVNDNNV